MPETAATICNLRSICNLPSKIGKLLNTLQLTLIRRGVVRRDAHFERQCLVSRRAHFDAMRTRVEVQTLKDPVEVVDDADEVSVDVNLCVARLQLQTKRSFVVVRGARLWRRRVTAVPRVVIAAVVPAVPAGAVPPRIVVAVAAV